ncbi:uncharacterized protein BT62DRAFT_1000253 [Guyanagaster necrorhizus]|uniref:Histidine kinase n=1 Tax=Guyanagaster necrorhizus TaxID=856835 RepID=A0A9P7W2Z3_9AGAR|nr:uncharacterized protein BT62DRAFT_1000253 [Guyanagaster necrorhizus MCA 3950]KAG7451020.1 hypothetical protein BT62DRAFT_1000253 [Guyanagaster necrorhizus MCA 3950]
MFVRSFATLLTLGQSGCCVTQSSFRDLINFDIHCCENTDGASHVAQFLSEVVREFTSTNATICAQKVLDRSLPSSSHILDPPTQDAHLTTTFIAVDRSPRSSRSLYRAKVLVLGVFLRMTSSTSCGLSITCSYRSRLRAPSDRWLHRFRVLYTRNFDATSSTRTCMPTTNVELPRSGSHLIVVANQRFTHRLQLTRLSPCGTLGGLIATAVSNGHSSSKIWNTMAIARFEEGGGLPPRLRVYDDNYSGFHYTIVRNSGAALPATQIFEQGIQRVDELRALDLAKTTFSFRTSLMNYERPPLTLIHGPCHDALKAVNRTRFKLIYRASGRLPRLVNSLMLFSSAEARRLHARFCPVRLGPATADMASLFRSAVEKAGIDYNITCDNSADERIAYVDLGIRIRLDLTYTSSEVILSVQDTGCGIPEDQLDKILLRFHPVESSDGRTIEGTGIGLALTNELVKIHQGMIIVQSIKGHGSVFTVRIPLGCGHLREKDVDHDFDMALAGTGSYAAGIVEEAAAWLGEDSDTSSQLSHASSTDVIMGSERFTVLLAEDNADARSYIKSILLNAVQDVVDVSDGQAALDYIHTQERPDLIVTDIMMQRMTGTELPQKLAEDPDPDIQAILVIVLSASTGSEDRPDSVFRGAVDFLLKPFISSELLNRVRNRLHVLKQRHELEKQVRDRTFELKVTQQRYQRMSELSSVAIFETEDVDHGLITYAPRTLPLPLKCIIDRLAPELQEAATRACLDAPMINGEPVQFDAVFENGKNAFVEVIALSDGRLLGTLTDQTEQRRVATEQLSEERMYHFKNFLPFDLLTLLQETFIDIVSHELRNPLSAIVQSAELLSSSIARLQDILDTLQSMNSNHDADKLFEESNVELKDTNHAVSSVALCARHQTIIAAYAIFSGADLLDLTSRRNPTTFHLLEELQVGSSLHFARECLQRFNQATLDIYSVQAAAQSIDLRLTIRDDIERETCIIADPTR